MSVLSARPLIFTLHFDLNSKIYTFLQKYPSSKYARICKLCIGFRHFLGYHLSGRISHKYPHTNVSRVSASRVSRAASKVSRVLFTFYTNLQIFTKFQKISKNTPPQNMRESANSAQVFAIFWDIIYRAKFTQICHEYPHISIVIGVLFTFLHL